MSEQEPVANITPMAVDPVCGMEVDRAANKPRGEHRGVTYHFCCPGCAEKFLADPERYLDPKPAAAVSGLLALLMLPV